MISVNKQFRLVLSWTNLPLKSNRLTLENNMQLEPTWTILSGKRAISPRDEQALTLARRQCIRDYGINARVLHMYKFQAEDYHAVCGLPTVPEITADNVIPMRRGRPNK